MDYDAFLHVFLGEELSVKGDTTQADGLLSTALALRDASANATEVRVQFQENRWMCGQFNSGRFFKIASCARAALAYAKRHNVRYELFAVARPDNMYKSEFPSSCLLDADGRVLPDAFSVDHEVWFAPFSSVETTFASLDDPERLECCNMTSRTPKGCFWAGLAEPDATFIYMRHLQSNGLKLASKRAGCHWTNEIRRNGSVHLMREHGKYRPHVTPHETPDVVSLDSLIYLLESGARAQQAAAVARPEGRSRAR